jgi:hypothetical protein
MDIRVVAVLPVPSAPSDNHDIGPDPRVPAVVYGFARLHIAADAAGRRAQPEADNDEESKN